MDPHYVHLASTWHHSRDQVFRFCVLLQTEEQKPGRSGIQLPCVVLNANWRTKNRGGLGLRLGVCIQITYYTSSPSTPLLGKDTRCSHRTTSTPLIRNLLSTCITKSCSWAPPPPQNPSHVHLQILCIILNTNQRAKTGEAWEWGYLMEAFFKSNTDILSVSLLMWLPFFSGHPYIWHTTVHHDKTAKTILS